MFFSKQISSPPQAFSVQTSNQFDSYDGNWSTFNLNVGNAGQFQSFRFPPSTSSFSIWLPDPEGCNVTASDFDYPSSVPGNIWTCASSRGVGNFNSNQSTGYLDADSLGLEKLNVLGKDLSITDIFGSHYADISGEFGLQNLSLNSALASKTSELNTPKAVPVNGLSSWQYYLPTLGIGIGETLFGSALYNSTLSVLASANIIPSLSWGYTAGTSYKSSKHDQFFGSLVIGGYDETRLDSNSTVQIPMPLGANTTELRVEVSSVMINFINGKSPRSGGIQFPAVIESTLPYLYLPPEICNMFKEVFNLTGPDSSDLYTLSNATVASNRANIGSVDFVIQEIGNSTNTVTIELPYAAFDVMASWTHNYPEPQPIIPIRPMASDTAILGRVFLQEAYVSANYEPDTMSFNVSKAAFPTTVGSVIQTIYSQSNKDLLNSQSHKLSGGEITAIVLCTLFAVAAIAFLVWRYKSRGRAGPSSDPDPGDTTADEKGLSDQAQVAELTSRPSHRRHMSELSSESEQDTPKGMNAIHEMSNGSEEAAELETPPKGSPAPQELEGEGHLKPTPRHEGDVVS